MGSDAHKAAVITATPWAIRSRTPPGRPSNTQITVVSLVSSLAAVLFPHLFHLLKQAQREARLLPGPLLSSSLQVVYQSGAFRIGRALCLKEIPFFTRLALEYWLTQAMLAGSAS